MVLSINPAAKRLFHAGEFAVGRDFLLMERSREISDAITHTMQSGHSEISLSRDGRIHQIDMSRIKSDVKHAAAYLNAKIELQSEVGKGTTVQVVFTNISKE